MSSEFFEIDLINYKERRSARVTEGRYRVRVTDWELTRANSGNQMMNMWLTILDGDDPDAIGEVILDRLVATKNAAFRVVHAVKAMGLDPNVGGKLRLPGRAVMNRTMLVDLIDDDPYNGRIKSAVADYFPDPQADHSVPSPAADLPAVDDSANPADVGDDLPEPAQAAQPERRMDHADDVPVEPEPDEPAVAEPAPAPVQPVAGDGEGGRVVSVDEVSL